MAKGLSDRSERGGVPALADALRSARARIIQRWQELVRAAFPNVHPTSIGKVGVDVSALVERLATFLAGDGPREPAFFMQDQGASDDPRMELKIEDLLTEYRLVRQAVFEETAGELSRPLSTAESLSVNLALDLAVQQAVVAFVERQNRQSARADEARASNLSLMSHELRGNLNGVVLTVELLRRELEKTPGLAESVKELLLVRRMIMDTVAMMGRFMTAERLRQGRVELHIGKIDLAVTCREIAAEHTPEALAKSVKLVVEVSADACLHSDRELIAMALRNLVSNAVRYSEAGVVTIRGVPWEEADRRGWTLGVIDHGPGIPAERIATLLDPFVRSKKRCGGGVGMGLGLPIAQMAATALGAKLSVESAVGRGTTFSLRLTDKPPPPRPADGNLAEKSSPA